MDRDTSPVACVARLAALALCIALVACQRAPRDGGASLGLVDYWPSEQMLFVAARDVGYVDVFRLSASGSQSGLEFVQRLQHPDQTHVIRIVVDRSADGCGWLDPVRCRYIAIARGSASRRRLRS